MIKRPATKPRSDSDNIKHAQWAHAFTVSIATLFFCWILWLLYSVNTRAHNVLFDPLINLSHSIEYGDKVGHFLLYGCLSFLANLAFRLKVINLFQIPIFKGTALVLVFVALEETSQFFIPSRTFDLIDMTANLGGILFFAIVSYLALRLRPSKIKDHTQPK